MITEQQFIAYIGQLSDVYENVKDKVYAACPRTTDAMDINEQLGKFRDIACTALRASHVTKNVLDN